MAYLLLVIAVVFLFFVVSYNKLVTLRTKAEEGFATIDVFLKKRYDLIPNLVETVKGYTSHEKDTLDAVINARARAMNGSQTERIEGEGELSQALGRLLALSEAYPELKANTQFTQLQQELSQLESEIERSRRYYNGAASQLNIAVQKFPTVLIAGAFGFKEIPYFEIEQEQRENVKVQF